MSNLIYFDGGGGGIRAQAIIDGNKSEITNFPGFSHGEAELVNYQAEIVINFANQVGGEISRAVLAVAVLPADTKGFESIAKLVFSSTKVRELWICSDSVSSSAAEIKDDGVVIAAGTGITALAVGQNRRKLHTLSGDGYLIADKTSAYWIGKMGLALATRAYDGRDQSPGARELLEVACKEFDTEPYFLPHVVHQQERAVHGIAQFAKKVSELAEHGNKKALEIIEDAASEIALIATTAKRELEGDENFQVALIGGVLSPDTLVYKMSVAKIKEVGLTVSSSGKTPLDGAAVLAQMPDPGVFTPMIKVFKAN